MTTVADGSIMEFYPAGADELVDELFEAAKLTIEEAGYSFEPDKVRTLIAKALGKAKDQATEEAKASVTVGGALRPGVSKSKTSMFEGAPYWYESEKDRELMDWYITSRREGNIEGNLLITGPAGLGKTQGIIEAGKRLNLPVYIVNAASMTDPEKWVGHKEVDAEGTHFYLAEPMRWLEARDCEPGIWLLDEITRLHPTNLNITLPLFDGQRRLFVPEAHSYIDVHPQVVPIATANMGGRYTGTFRMDHALRERFGYTIERTFPPAEDEVQILTSRFPEAEEKLVRLMVDIANRTRQKWFTQDLEVPVSTRMLVHAAALLRDGASIVSAFERTVLPFYSTDGGEQSERELVRGIIEGKQERRK